jgi:hypothetical protein
LFFWCLKIFDLFICVFTFVCVQLVCVWDQNFDVLQCLIVEHCDRTSSVQFRVTNTSNVSVLNFFTNSLIAFSFILSSSFSNKIEFFEQIKWKHLLYFVSFLFLFCLCGFGRKWTKSFLFFFQSEEHFLEIHL